MVLHSLPGLVVILAGYIGGITWTCSMFGIYGTSNPFRYCCLHSVYIGHNSCIFSKAGGVSYVSVTYVSLHIHFKLFRTQM